MGHVLTEELDETGARLETHTTEINEMPYRGD
jgi:hypothetical protein